MKPRSAAFSVRLLGNDVKLKVTVGEPLYWSAVKLLPSGTTVAQSHLWLVAGDLLAWWGSVRLACADGEVCRFAETLLCPLETRALGSPARAPRPAWLRSGDAR